MPDKQYNIEITINGKDAASAPLGKVNDTLGEMGTIAGGVLLAKGLEKLTGAIVAFGKGALGAAADDQALLVSLQTLAAREEVVAGRATSVEAAFDSMRPKAEALDLALDQLSLRVPFTASTIENTFAMNMAFGLTSDIAMKVTNALLDVGAALRLDSGRVEMLTRGLGMIAETGEITTMGLRQFRLVGLDLATVFKDELGMSIDEVNKKLKSNQMTFEEVSTAFVDYVEKNYGGASEKMGETFNGLGIKFKNLMEYAGEDLMSPTLDVVTVALGGVYKEVKGLVDSGYFAELGGALGENVARILDNIGKNGFTATDAIKGLGDGILGVTDALADLTGWYDKLGPQEKDFVNTLLKIGAVAVPVAAGVSLLSKGIAAVGALSLASINPLTAVAVTLAGIAIVADQGAKNYRNHTAAVHAETDANAMLSESYNGYVQIMAGALHEKGLLSNADAQALLDAARQGKSIDDLAVSQRGLTDRLGLMTQAEWEWAKAIQDGSIPVVGVTKGINGLREAFNQLRMKQDSTKVSLAGYTGGVVTYEYEMWQAEQATRSTMAVMAGSFEVLEYIEPASIELADSMGILQSALGDAGIKGDAYNLMLGNMQVITGQLAPAQYQLQTDMGIITRAFAAGGITAQQMADYMKQAENGTLALGASERYAMKDFADGKAALDGLATATLGLASNQLTLAANLKDATQAQIAQTAVTELQKAYDSGKISFEQFSTAVSGVQQAFGLATPASQALALGLQGIILGLEGNLLPAANFDDALKYIITDSHDGSVNIGEILDKFATTTSVMTPANKSFDDAALQLANLNLKVSGLNTDIAGFDWNALGKSVGQGLADGMMASEAAVAAAAAALAKAAEDGIADPLGSNSPSQAMFLQGQYAVEGFVLGLMSDAMGGVEQNMAGLFAGYAEGSGGSIDSHESHDIYDIDINDSSALEIFLEQQRMARLQRANDLM